MEESSGTDSRGVSRDLTSAAITASTTTTTAHITK